MSFDRNGTVRMKPDEFFEYRNKIQVQNIEVNPGKLKAVLKDGQLYLEVESQKNDLFRIEEIFIKKLFRWFYTGTEMVPLLSAEAKLHVINNLLSTVYMRGQKYPDNYVKLRVEDGSVYSILAKIYETVEDTEFYGSIRNFGITAVEYSPYITRFLSEIKLQTEAVPGDRMGYAFHFTNSQTGFGALSASVYVLRYWCSNGAVSSAEKGQIFYHGPGAFRKFSDSVQGFEEQFNDMVPEFDRGLVKARGIEFAEKLHPGVKLLIGPALSVYESKEMMKSLARCKNLWEVYDHLTTTAKNHEIYQKFLLQEAAGRIITQMVLKGNFSGEANEALN